MTPVNASLCPLTLGSCKVWRQERPLTRFFRTFVLPLNADRDHISAFLDKVRAWD